MRRAVRISVTAWSGAAALLIATSLVVFAATRGLDVASALSHPAELREPSFPTTYLSAEIGRAQMDVQSVEAMADAQLRARAALKSASAAVTEAGGYGLATAGFETRLQAAQRHYVEAVTVAEFNSVAAEADGLLRDVHRAIAAASIPACGRLIDLDLTTQELVASYCGQAFLSAPITSGMPGLRTPTGTFSIFLKERNVYFYSPWPAGSPYHYPPMFVAYAMEFLGGGYFIHTDPNEPSGAYGAGSQNGPYASHGCVHVPTQAMVSLFSWSSYGTTVRIHY